VGNGADFEMDGASKGLEFGLKHWEKGNWFLIRMLEDMVQKIINTKIQHHTHFLVLKPQLSLLPFS